MKCLHLIAAILLCAAPPGMAQLSQLKQVVQGTKPENAAKPENPEDTRKRLEQWHQETREALKRLEAAGTTAPAGISPNEIDDRRRDLEQMLLITTSSLKNLGGVEDARKEAEQARAEEAAWTGFKESPPYSILMLDELLNERDAILAKHKSHESSLATYETLLANNLNEAKLAEDSVNAAIAAVQNAAPEQQDAAKWRLDAARAKARLLAARAAYMQASCLGLKDRIAASQADLALVERKISSVRPQANFSEQDLAQIEKLTSERRKAAAKELAAVSKRLNTALANRAQAQAALDTGEAADPASDSHQLAKFRLEVAESRIESLQSVTEALESLVQLENTHLKAYQDRHAVMHAADSGQRAKALDALRVLDERLSAWLNVVTNEAETTGAELSKIESRAATITAEDPRFPLLNEQRAARSEKLAMIQRASQAVGAQRKLVRRWVADFSPKEDERGLLERVGGSAAAAWAGIGKIWNFQLMAFEEKVEVDGQTLTGKIPVTVGMLLRALMFFLIGYFIASRIANRIQRGVVARGHIAEAQARTLRNWAMIAVGVLLVIGTLSFLKIPLTVFAFFGGALAIGIGFGTQTLIKNFISGIIVLVERKIRVGDILDVDGIVGTVTEVNTRSSVIRSPDEVETMIPNSLFLENRVTNWTLSSGRMRRNVRVGVAYGSDPRKVMDILVECAGRHGLICKEPAPFAVFDDFADSALMFTVYFWVDLHGEANAMVLASDLRLMIDKRLHEVGIGIPFPQRDLHLTTSEPIAVRLTHDE